MRLKIGDLKQTRSFYNWKLKDRGLTEEKRSKFLRALKIIKKIIKKKEDSREK
ncbi:hypothetical protein ES708_20000 [subsurface metagenome]|jgi:hypothetical protein